MSVFELILVRIQSECAKIQTRITSNADTFYAVLLSRITDTACEYIESEVTLDKVTRWCPAKALYWKILRNCLGVSSFNKDAEQLFIECLWTAVFVTLLNCKKFIFNRCVNVLFCDFWNPKNVFKSPIRLFYSGAYIGFYQTSAITFLLSQWFSAINLKFHYRSLEGS